MVSVWSSLKAAKLRIMCPSALNHFRLKRIRSRVRKTLYEKCFEGTFYLHKVVILKMKFMFSLIFGCLLCKKEQTFFRGQFREYAACTLKKSKKKHYRQPSHPLADL